MKTNRRQQSERRARHGFVLVVVLIVIAMLSLAGYAFTDLMSTEYKTTRLQGRLLDSQCLAQSGVELAKCYLAMSPAARQEFGGHFDNRERFQAVRRSPDAEARGWFSLVAPPRADENPPKLRFGLANESAKLNLRAVLKWDEAQPGAGRAALLNLPGMTDELADAILDWVDADNLPREFGAESEHYGGLEPRYTPPNAAPAALEELLWVRGATRAMLFGDDRNQNGAIEAEEFEFAERNRQTSGKSAGPFGWSVFLTVDSAEGSLNPKGEPKTDLNQPGLQRLHQEVSRALEEPWATFIVAYRQFGPYLGSGTSAETGAFAPDFAVPPRFPINSVLDLVAVRVQVAYPGRPPVILPSPFENSQTAMREYLPRLLDFTRVDPQERVIGRVDVNEAPREVLMAIPGISAGLVEDIVSKRGREPGVVDEAHRHVSWLLTEGVVPLEQLKPLMKHLTAGGDVYRTQAVGYQENGPICRADILLDATSRPPRLVSWRGLERLGRGYDVAVLGARYDNNLP